ncbi:MAG: U32 family peptidase [Clostridia bacterium]|nr:U32 family peptidase [Clostridia bacterium]
MVVLGNRGKCAGPCRLPYELLAESNENSTNKKTLTLDKGYLLSPKDLCGLAHIPRLIQAGVKCFKIEGRMKNPEYVATVTRIYRKYIDLALSEQQYVIDEQDITDLMQVFNRGGFSSGHLDNNSNRSLIFPEKPNHMGIYLGTVQKYNSNKGHITLSLEAPLSIGDSVSLERETGSYLVSELMEKNTNLKTADVGNYVTIGRMKGKISIGDKLYKVSSKRLMEEARFSYENCENKKIPLNCNVTIKKDIPIQMELFTINETHPSNIYHQIKVKVTSDIIPTEALKTPISMERIIKQVSKTNNTPYTFENITVYLDDGLYVPSISSLNELRRNAIESLEKEVEKRILRKSPEFDFKNEEAITYIPNLEHPKISLFLRDLHVDYDYTQLEKDKIDKVYLSLKLFVDKQYTDIIEYLSEQYNLYIYLPTIIKGNYKNIILNSFDDITTRFSIKGFVLSNIADFEFLKKYQDKYEFIGNYSLNVFNHHTMKEYKKLGIDRVTLSRELNEEGLKDILQTSDIDTELIVYGNLPIMVSNYCFLGKTNHCYPDCGQNCTKISKYYLKDRLGFEFRIIPDSFQTVTLICNSKTLSISTKNLPITSVRLDMMDETIEQINEAISKAYIREKLEGMQYTNGNLHREV